MSGHGRPARLLRILLTVLVACASETALAVHHPPPVPPDVASHASLADVTFVNPECGWAVGDHGVIWHTRDGGGHWYLQASPVGCRLESVSFFDSQIGWAVGGWTHPYTHKTTGVVLQTLDGGRNWQLLERHLLPKLKGVRLSDAKRAVVWGAASAMYPSGVWQSNDRGRSFTPILGTGFDGGTTGDMSAPNALAVVSQSGRPAVVDRGELSPSEAPRSDLRRSCRLRLRDDGVGLLVGDGGLVWVTVDAGHKWFVPPQVPPPQIAKHFDFAAAELGSDRAWVAGSPGSYVFRTSDGGRSWQRYATGQTLPIHGLCFADDQRGWAVGALGTILATEDSGETWQRQLGGGARVAALGLFSHADEVPIEAFSQLSANEGYLTAIEIVGESAGNAGAVAEASWSERVREAFSLAGVSATRVHWQFPLRDDGIERDAGRIMAEWNGGATDNASENARLALVRAIRQWRPNLIITDAERDEDDESLAALTRQLVLAAVRDAGNRQSDVEQQRATGLAPWQVRRILAATDDATDADVVLTTSQLVPHVARSLAEHADIARQLLVIDSTPAPATLAFRKLTDERPSLLSSAAGQGGNDFFYGMTRPGDEARRPPSSFHATGMASLRKKVQLRRNLEQLMAKSSGQTESEAARLAQISQLARELGQDAAAELLYQLAAHQRRGGHPELAAETLESLVSRHGDHPLAEASLLWLVRYYASGEMAWQLRRQSKVVARQVFAETPQGPTRFPTIENRPANFVTPVGDQWQDNRPGAPVDLNRTRPDASNPPTSTRDDRYGQTRDTMRIADLIRRTRPSLAAEPAVGLPVAAVERWLHRRSQAEQIYRQILAARDDDPWSRCAHAELGPMQQAGPPAKPSAICVRAGNRPYLDGKLDEAVWQTARPIELTENSPEGAPRSARARMAWDQDYLYFAIECRRNTPIEVDEPEETRQRDADLANEDRVDLLIDVDRDYATYYRLSVDHRGFTCEACMGDETWNPKWFVAAASQPHAWTIEAAIPWQELVPEPPQRGDRWALGVQRVIPRVAFQSWTKPAGIHGVPQGFGLLTFD